MIQKLFKGVLNEHVSSRTVQKSGVTNTMLKNYGPVSEVSTLFQHKLATQKSIKMSCNGFKCLNGTYSNKEKEFDCALDGGNESREAHLHKTKDTSISDTENNAAQAKELVTDSLCSGSGNNRGLESRPRVTKPA